MENKDFEEAQESSCAFGSFYIMYKGVILLYDPTSNKRFTNIMNSNLI